MKINKFTVANLRGIESASMTFQAGFNLIVGVNGVGKTSILEGLGICLSDILKQLHGLRSKAESFSEDHIRIGAKTLDVALTIHLQGKNYEYFLHRPSDATAAKSGFHGETPKISLTKPMAILFGTRRALASERTPSKGSTEEGIKGALADAFSDRELRLGEFAQWMHVQKALVGELPQMERYLQSIEEAVRDFLPGYENLRLDRDKKLIIDHGDKTLPIRSLSDGERGILALVLDLSRRLTQANPGMDLPNQNGEAVVLIDEIDLHLHPKWQRQVIHKLTNTFPNCQFIATTHSPQIIGEVPHDHIQIIREGEVYAPPQSFGIDSSRVLEEIMEARPRNKQVQKILTTLSRAISDEELEKAHHVLAELIEIVGENDPEVIHANTLLDFLED